MHWFPTGYDLRLETNAHDHNIQAIVKKIDRAIKNSERKSTFMRTLMVFVFDISVERQTSKQKVAGSNPSRNQVDFFSACPVWVCSTWSSVNILIIILFVICSD